jgi:RNA 2',3'-cyclic 3'-phosphodiesterase
MPESERYRLFVAVAVPDDVKAKMAAAQADLRRVLPDRNVRWTRREQFHLTLRFLGDAEAARVEALAEAIRTACAGFGALHLRAERIGCFPDRGYPRVVWVGVRDEAEQLPRLQQVVQAATEGFTAEPKEERFTGHLTLARIKGIKRPEADALGKAAAGMADMLFGQWTAHQIELMRSELLPQGARHSSLASIALAPLPADLA